MEQRDSDHGYIIDMLCHFHTTYYISFELKLISNKSFFATGRALPLLYDATSSKKEMFNKFAL